MDPSGHIVHYDPGDPPEAFDEELPDQFAVVQERLERCEQLLRDLDVYFRALRQRLDRLEEVTPRTEPMWEWRR
jgi:adenylosuccinate lyase